MPTPKSPAPADVLPTIEAYRVRADVFDAALALISAHPSVQVFIGLQQHARPIMAEGVPVEQKALDTTEG